MRRGPDRRRVERPCRCNPLKPHQRVTQSTEVALGYPDSRARTARHQPVVAHTSHAHLAAIEHAIGNAEHVVGIEFLLHRFDDLDVGL